MFSEVSLCKTSLSSALILIKKRRPEAPRTYKKTETLSSLVNKIKRALRVEQEANYQRMSYLRVVAEVRGGWEPPLQAGCGPEVEPSKEGAAMGSEPLCGKTRTGVALISCIDQGLSLLSSAITKPPRLELRENRRFI